LQPLRIFYNRNYSTVYHALMQLRDNPDRCPLHIIGSHTRPESPVLSACDERHIEPPDTDPDHVDWLVRLCRERRVDVFVPRAGQLEIAKRVEEFNAQGTQVIVMSPEKINTLENKAETYRVAKSAGLEVPPWFVVESADDLVRARDALGRDKLLISKPVAGVGADGFRMIVDQKLRGREVFAGSVRQEVVFDDLALALKEVEGTDRGFSPLLVMPYLAEPEISVDLLAVEGRVLAAIPREKNSHVRKLSNNPEVLRYIERTARVFELDGLANVQLRWLGDRPMLLEINTRAAAGSYQGKLSGVDLSWEAIRLAAGEAERPLRPKLGIEYYVLDRLVPRPQEPEI
jgi:biotin carboxylase